jgi:hypothetical protein
MAQSPLSESGACLTSTPYYCSVLNPASRRWYSCISVLLLMRISFLPDRESTVVQIRKCGEVLTRLRKREDATLKPGP